jgi:hypothetical protein
MYELVHVLEDYFHILVTYCMDLWEINDGVIGVTLRTNHIGLNLVWKEEEMKAAFSCERNMNSLMLDLKFSRQWLLVAPLLLIHVLN